LASRRKIDVLIAGAGFSGLVLAERLSNCGLKCVVLEKRSHIGGNAWDTTDANGVLYHPYGPHYFRTNSRTVREYLSKFTGWHFVDYRIKSWSHGRYWSFPVNLQTYEELIGKASNESEFESWLNEQRVEIAEPQDSEQVILASAGRQLYELFFQGYTLKQWGRHPRDLDPSVCGRIPIRTTRDDRYLKEEFQALPSEGYHRLFESMVEASPHLEVKLGVDFFEARDAYEPRHTVYSGPVDAYFDYQYGRLPWRSIRFELESFRGPELIERESISGRIGFWQPAMQVNYPNDLDFTRIVEVKHATSQQTDHTNIVREFPVADAPGREPYYPVPAPDARALYERYQLRASAETNVSFIGRLAAYRYYNMDQVVALALKEADQLKQLLNS
jgi:UDP-galactopyranose mutase